VWFIVFVFVCFFHFIFLLNTRKAGLNFREDEIHWVLTIPAIWKDDSKQFMRESTKQVFNNADQKKTQKQIAGMVKTQWISSSLKLSPAFLVLLKKWSLKYLIDSEKTVSADIDLPLSSNNFILLLI
jgi:hypothetical protein